MKNKIKLVLDRSSVCMGDDAMSHKTEIELDSGGRLSDLVNKIYEINYLPTISGGKATWILYYGKSPLAVMTQEEEVFYLFNKGKLLKTLFQHDDKAVTLFYHRQDTGEVVYRKLRDELRNS